MTATTSPHCIDLSGIRQHVNDYYWPLMWDRHRRLVFRGGAGSGKSVFCTQKLLTRAAREVDAQHKIGVFRKVARTHRESTYSLFLETLGRWGWRDYVRTSTNPMEITFEPTGARFVFLGLDDPEKLKSISGLTSAWIEEATELTEADFDQINLRIRGETATYKQIMLSFNPISAQHWIKRRLFDAPQDGRTRTILTTYKDNHFLDAEYIAELENLANVDDQLYRIYTLGQWGELKGLIYAPWEIPAQWPVAFDATFYGLDFGYNDPMALVRVDVRDSAYYLTELFYERGKTTADLIAGFPDMGLRKGERIYCDSAEPDRIEEIHRAGYNALPAHKGQGSVKAGISFLQAATIYTRAENVNLASELSTYKWQEDKNGQLLEEPIDFHNHLLDAARYAIYSRWVEQGQGFRISRL